MPQCIGIPGLPGKQGSYHFNVVKYHTNFTTRPHTGGWVQWEMKRRKRSVGVGSKYLQASLGLSPHATISQLPSSSQPHHITYIHTSRTFMYPALGPTVSPRRFYILKQTLPYTHSGSSPRSCQWFFAGSASGHTRELLNRRLRPAGAPLRCASRCPCDL
jgi:hypothetical protein